MCVYNVVNKVNNNSYLTLALSKSPASVTSISDTKLQKQDVVDKTYIYVK